jgi:hypothetical protein
VTLLPARQRQCSVLRASHICFSFLQRASRAIGRSSREVFQALCAFLEAASLESKPWCSSKEKLGVECVLYTVKGARGKVSFDSQTDKYASQLSSDASPEVYLSP